MLFLLLVVLGVIVGIVYGFGLLAWLLIVIGLSAFVVWMLVFVLFIGFFAKTWKDS